MSKVSLTEKINIVTSCLIEKLTMLTLSALPKASSWLGITVTFATKFVRVLNTCVQEDATYFVVNQSSGIALATLRALMYQVEEQASNEKILVLS